MTFKQNLLRLAADAPNHISRLKTEEATKHTLIVPFFELLGFKMTGMDSDAIPEYTADVAGKKGEKVDYALKKDKQIIMLVECKPVNTKLVRKHTDQLERYFYAVDDAAVGILTNGVHYRFYADLVNLNKLDPTPFFEFNLANIDDQIVQELELFTKDNFDRHIALERARELTYTKEIQDAMISELSNPSDTFIRFFTSKVYKGRKTTSVTQQFAPIVKQALQQLFINPTEQLVSVLATAQAAKNSADKKKDLSFTDDELAGYQVVKSLLGQTFDPSRITMRKNMSYSPILLDDSNRRTICRLYFNRSQKYLGLFDHERNETRVSIDTIEDILAYSTQMKATVRFLNTGEVSEALQITPIKSEHSPQFEKQEQAKIISLSRGENISLSQFLPPVKQILVGLSWDITDDEVAIDSSAFLLDANGQVLSDEHFIFYNKKVSPDGAVEHLGNNQTSITAYDDETT